MRFLLFALTACTLLGQEGTLRVKAKPGRAGVFVNGQYLGPAANFAVTRTYKVAAGEHELRLSDPRYEDFTQKIKVEAGKVTEVSWTMQKAAALAGPFGELRITGGDKFAGVFLNGKFAGHVDEFDNFAQRVRLAPGDYELKIVPAGGSSSPHVEQIKVGANQQVWIKLSK
ncbi:MAG: PEGA domain-containing protein [Bryobacteraceae bacterium]|nr:PEGA domain-containing protein [Bryobacteraceae bacterium]